MYETISLEHTPPFAYLTLNRPDVRNAMNQQMIEELLHAFKVLQRDRDVRAVVISGAGNTFCAGADIKEMQVAYSKPHSTEDDTRHTAQFDELLEAVNTAPQVVIACVEGAAMGGGFGLVCVSDIAIASTEAIFGLPEVRLGIVPALISPYVIHRLGLTTTRKLMLTGARFDGNDALRYGLVHEVCEPDKMRDCVAMILEDIRQASPEALAACKALIFHVMEIPLKQTTHYRAELLDSLRRSESGQEGMLAFIQKRKPKWAKTDQSEDE